ncbi:CorA family divalent cation transporter [Acinetobacter baumannii]|uniref:CorA family divalent cation transporter n=1 Tax=Acinetobacter baumannii TaxID=470 RepID=UPI00385B88E3
MTPIDAIKALKMWQRLSAEEAKDLEYLSQIHAIHFSPVPTFQDNQSFNIRCIKIEKQKIVMTDLLWYLDKDHEPLYTVENRHRVLKPLQAFERLEFQHFSLDSSHTVAMIFLYQLLVQTIHVINYIDKNVTDNATSIRNIQIDNHLQYTIGVEDLVDIDNHLNQMNMLSGYVFNAVNDIEIAARQLRNKADLYSQLDTHHVEELMHEIEVTKRRVHFLIERQRFHWNMAGESVANSNLSITKIFSVLWAAFIPGLTLVNWYGQNFRVMPELSWGGTMPTQLLAVLVLTAIPVWMVKQAGSLR